MSSLFAVLLGLASCQRVGPSVGEPSSPAPRPAEPRAETRVADVGGDWDATLRLEGNPEGIPGVLVLRQEGGGLTGSFSSPLGVNAAVTGSVVGGTVALTLSYNIECAGTATLVGAVDGDRGQVEGTVEISDCTGEVTGTFELTRGV